jgi:hypothetical protein
MNRARRATLYRWYHDVVFSNSPLRCASFVGSAIRRDVTVLCRSARRSWAKRLSLPRFTSPARCSSWRRRQNRRSAANDWRQHVQITAAPELLWCLGRLSNDLRRWRLSFFRDIGVVQSFTIPAKLLILLLSWRSTQKHMFRDQIQLQTEC